MELAKIIDKRIQRKRVLPTDAKKQLKFFEKHAIITPDGNKKEIKIYILRKE